MPSRNVNSVGLAGQVDTWHFSLTTKRTLGFNVSNFLILDVGIAVTPTIFSDKAVAVHKLLWLHILLCEGTFGVFLSFL